MLFRRRHGMFAAAGEALARVLATPTFELIPLSHAMDDASSLPRGARVSVTASSLKGIEATVGLARSSRRPASRQCRICRRGWCGTART
jgi:hypothetical protein